MRPAAAYRVFADRMFGRDFSDSYQSARQMAGLAIRLTGGHRLAWHLAQDCARFVLGAPRPISGETDVRARAALAWILRAQDAAADGGVSLGYFPYEKRGGWHPSYPETTGYIIDSLLVCARRFDLPQVRARALQMARWEIDTQMACGAIPAGTAGQTSPRVPVVFNTGMVLGGWSASYRSAGDVAFLEAGRRAARFLIGDIDATGFFRTHGPLVVAGRIKTFTCLCAWPLYRFGIDSHDHRAIEAAVTVVEAALTQQQPNGWFANNCLTRPDAPLLHTIGYTLQGILEVGALAGRTDFIAAAERGARPLVERIDAGGFLPGRFYSDWERASFSECPSGSAQLAVICYRLYEETSRAEYLTAANRLVDHLKALQIIGAADDGINGALPGSHPLIGGYVRGGYPNWAAKYFIDALLFQDRLCRA